MTKNAVKESMYFDITDKDNVSKNVNVLNVLLPTYGSTNEFTHSYTAP